MPQDDIRTNRAIFVHPKGRTSQKKRQQMDVSSILNPTIPNCITESPRSYWLTQSMGVAFRFLFNICNSLIVIKFFFSLSLPNPANRTQLSTVAFILF